MVEILQFDMFDFIRCCIDSDDLRRRSKIGGITGETQLSFVGERGESAAVVIEKCGEIFSGKELIGTGTFNLSRNRYDPLRPVYDNRISNLKIRVLFLLSQPCGTK